MSSTKDGSTGLATWSVKTPLVVGLGVSSSFRRLFDRWRNPDDGFARAPSSLP